MKALVLYKSTAGHTQRYADMISQSIEAESASIDQFDLSLLANYDLIIFGGNLYAVGISGFKAFKKHLTQLQDRHIVIFAVGATPNKAGVVEEIREKNFLTEQEEKLPLFYLRGGFDYSKLPFKDKAAMSLLKLVLLLKRNKTPDELDMLASYKKPIDTVNEENLKELLSYIKGLNSD